MSTRPVVGAPTYGNFSPHMDAAVHTGVSVSGTQPHLVDQIKYKDDMEHLRRNANIAGIFSIVCFFTGCCNYCANCCIVPWLAIFGQKASAVPEDDMEQPRCCLICIEGRPADNVRNWYIDQ